MKYLFLTLISFVLIASMVSAYGVPSEPVKTPQASASAAQVTVQPESVQSGGGGNKPGQKCYTEWTYDGKEWVKRDIIAYRLHFDHKAFKRIYSPVVIQGDNCAIYPIMPGIYPRKPLQSEVGVTDTEPLPEFWYQMISYKGGN